MRDDILDDIDFEDEKPDSPVLEPMEYYMTVFIKDRADAYIRQWKRGDWMDFNPVPMLLGIPWLFYRKMYLPGIILSLLWLGFFGFGEAFRAVPLLHLIGLLVYLVLGGLPSLPSFLVLVIIMLGFGFGASGAYLRYAHYKINNIHVRYRHDPKQLLRTLRKEGGVDWKLLLFCLIFPIFVYNV